MATPPLPKRFLPLLAQAQNEAALRYGSQEAGLASILGQLSRQHERDLGAQTTANMSLLGSFQGADQRLGNFYTDAGITPQVQATLAGTPTGARLASELAQNRADIQQGLLGAQAGNQYQIGHINDQYNEGVQQISDQAQALLKERGIFTQDQLDQLISADRKTRHDAGLAAAKQAADDFNAEMQRQTSTANALIGQGLQPVLGPDGSVTVGSPLPGGKADPNAPGNQPKPKKPSKPTGADRSTQSQFRQAATWIKTLDESTAKDHRDGTGQIDPVTGVRDGTGKIIKGISDPAKRRQIVQEILLKGDRVSGIPSISGVGLDAALDMYFNKALSPETVAALHNAGAKVKFLGNGTVTANQLEAQRRKAIKKTNRPNANLAPDSNGQMRPT